MTIKTAAFAALLTFVPALAMAEGCGWGHSQQAMSCASGTTYDADQGKCVPVTT